MAKQDGHKHDGPKHDGPGAGSGTVGPRVDPQVVERLKRIHSNELSGLVRYLHYAHMIFGANRIPIVSWLKDQATESMDHAWKIGEKLTAFGVHPDMKVATMPETGKHSVLDVLREALEFERQGLEDYRALLALVHDDPGLEDWVRGFISAETDHLEDAEKMLRTM
jgi:bacterioferritin